jgi:hypothetical protein
MKVIFQFEDNKSKIILEPSNNIDQANLENVLALKGSTVQISPGTHKDLIIESRRGELNDLPDIG